MFKTTKAKIIFVIIFTIICILVTTILVIYKNIEIEEDITIDTIDELPKPQIQEEKDVEGLKDIESVKENNLKIEEKNATNEKVQARYFQINGLKDKKVQNKINKEIEQKALNCYKDKVKNMDEIINVSINMWNISNFANTISFELTYFATISDYTDDIYYDSFALNYDLNTGEQISFDKLFTPDAPIVDILRESAYYQLASDRAELNLAGELTVLDYGNIEEDVANIISLYQNKKIDKFYYNLSSIMFEYEEGKVINIDIQKYADYIAIYNRYLSEQSLFEESNI